MYKNGRFRTSSKAVAPHAFCFAGPIRFAVGLRPSGCFSWQSRPCCKDDASGSRIAFEQTCIHSLQLYLVSATIYTRQFRANHTGANMKNLVLGAGCLLLGSFTTSAIAQCRQAQVCDDYGRKCQVRQICNSSLDLPSIDLPPMRPLPSMELKPLPSMELPPLGTKRCEYKQVDGRWQNICQ